MLALLIAAAVTHHDITVSTQVLAWILGTACPILTALITKENLPSGVKAVVNSVLAVIAGLLAVAIKADGHIDLYAWLLAIGNALVLAWASYASLWKHVVAPTVEKATADFGIGPAVAKAA